MFVQINFLLIFMDLEIDSLDCVGWNLCFYAKVFFLIAHNYQILLFKFKKFLDCLFNFWIFLVKFLSKFVNQTNNLTIQIIFWLFLIVLRHHYLNKLHSVTRFYYINYILHHLFWFLFHGRQLLTFLNFFYKGLWSFWDFLFGLENWNHF